MLSKLKANKVILFVLSFAILFLMTCEDFQEETFTPDETDEMAISVFKDTNTVHIPAATLKYDSALTSFVVTHKGQKDTIAEDSFPALLDSLDQDTIEVTPGQEHYKVTVSKNITNGIYLQSTSAENVILYTDEQVNFNIVDDNNQSLTADKNMPLEVMSGYFSYDPEETDYPQIIIKTRYSYSLSSGDYLIKINTTEQTAETTFSLVVINEQ